MAYGQTDEITNERKERIKAVSLLLDVAKKKKTVADVRKWLEENYPELCYEETKTKKKKKW